MTTLSNILRDVLFELGDSKEGQATGGTTTTIVDSGLGGSDDDYNGGTVIVTYDSVGSGAAPEGQFGEVTGYTSASGTITSGTTLTAACAANDEYLVSTSKFSHFEVIRAVNRALQSIGDVPKVDTTTLDTAANQTEYAYKVAAKRQPPYQVDIQGKTSDANDNRWYTMHNWYYVPADAGTGGLIVFMNQPTQPRGVRYWYKGAHDAVRAYSDVIYEGIHPEWLVWESVYRIYRHMVGQRDAPDDLTDLIREADQRRIEAAAKHPMWKPKRKSKLLIVGRYAPSDDFTVPQP